jgi:16S rRNA (cytidine1402-2'-O)-methyltransferase
MGLVLSGFDATRFVFEGFLPRSGKDRKERIAEVAKERRTIVLYEAPHRVQRTIADLLAACGPARQVALARELTKLHEETWRGDLAAAVAHVAETAPRGEYVLVVEGAPDVVVAATDDAISAALRMALASGADRRTAIATVTASTGATKRRVYDLALTIPR